MRTAAEGFCIFNKHFQGTEAKRAVLSEAPAQSPGPGAGEPPSHPLTRERERRRFWRGGHPALSRSRGAKRAVWDPHVRHPIGTKGALVTPLWLVFNDSYLESGADVCVDFKLKDELKSDSSLGSNDGNV